jgi:ankyrin repeat protein
MKQPIAIIEDLLKRKDVNINGKNIFDDGWTALHYAVHEGSSEVVKLLIETFQAQIDIRASNNKTPLHLACARGDEQVIKYLIDKGASPCVVDRDGCTPLHYLCEGENHDMIQFIMPLSGGARDVRNRFGLKPVDLIKDKTFKRTLRRFSSKRDSSSHSTSKSKTRINS